MRERLGQERSIESWMEIRGSQKEVVVMYLDSGESQRINSRSVVFTNFSLTRNGNNRKYFELLL